MGEKEAKRDGVEFYIDHKSGKIVYQVNCSDCGKPIERNFYGRDAYYVCDECKKKKAFGKKVIEKAWFDVLEEKGERRYNKAVDNIQKQVRNFSEYEKAIEIARKGQDKYGSIPEAMVAVELARLKRIFIPQQRIGKYKVDFYLPRDKIILEIDGIVYHRNQFKGEREAVIQLSIGLDVHIHHIPAELIAKDIQKLEKILEMP